jgi:hypothetical protein
MTGDDLLPYITRGPVILALVIGFPSLLFGYYVMTMLGFRIVTDRLPVLAPPRRRLGIFLLITAVGLAISFSAPFTTWARTMTAIHLADTLNHAGRPGVSYHLSVMNAPPDAITLLVERNDQTVASVQIKRVDLKAALDAIAAGSIPGADPGIITLLEKTAAP